MVISDEERREVAERLRSASTRRGDAPWMVEDLMLALGFRCYEDGEDQLFDRLADLIDRPTCCNVYDEIYDEYEGGCCDNGFKCSKCGELVEDFEGYRITGTFNYCSKCGREVVS